MAHADAMKKLNTRDKQFIMSKSNKQKFLSKIPLLELNSLQNNNLTFGHANTAGLLHNLENCNITRLDIIQTFLLLNKIMLFSVCETHLSENQEIQDQIHQSYAWIDYPRVGGAAWGGTGIFVHRSLQVEDITQNFSSPVESTFISFSWSGKTFIFGSVYLPQTNFVEIDNFLALLDKILLLDYDGLIICGDFNAWHIAWGDINNKRGRALLQGLNNRGLGVKKGNGPTRYGHDGQRDTYVDLVISNRGSELQEVNCGFQISDHVIINSAYTCTKRKPEQWVKKWDFRRTYEKNLHQLDTFFDEVDWFLLFENQEMEDFPFIFNKKVLEAWEKFGICKMVNSKSRPWFTPEVKKYRCKSRFWERHTRRGWRQNLEVVNIQGTMYSMEECKANWDKYRQLWEEKILALKQDSMKFIRRLLAKNVFSTVRRIYKHKIRSIPGLKVNDGQGSFHRVTSDVNKANLFLETFLENSKIVAEIHENKQYIDDTATQCTSFLKNFSCSGCEILRDGEPPTIVNGDILAQIREQTCMSLDTEFDPCETYFSAVEIRTLRNNLKKEKGSVGLNNDHIRKIQSGGVDIGLQFLFNSFWHFSYLPKYFRTSVIDPLFKGGADRVRSNVKHYRGIAKSDTVGRLFERAIYERLKSVILDKIKLYQGGGMPKRGTILQLLSIIERTHFYRSGCRKNTRGNIKPFNYVVLVLLDCSRAFDVFNRTLLLSRLHKMGVRGKLLEMMAAFYEERYQKVRVGGIESTIGIPRRGGPQGSVITLLSFLIVINDIGELVDGGEDDLHLFVDDVAFLVHGDKPKEVVNKINQRLGAVEAWSQNEGIAFPFDKFHLINIGKKKLPGRFKTKVKYGQNTPPWSLKAKYLGVYVDHHLHLRNHMEMIAQKVQKSMLFLSNNSNYVVGSSPKILYQIFQTYVFPHFLYGAPLWIFCLREKFRYNEPLVWGYGQVWLRLKMLYRKCGRWVLGVHPNTSGEAVLVRLGWLSLDYLLALHGLKLFLKLYHGHGGKVLHACTVDRGEHPGDYGQGVFFERAHEFLTYLNENSATNLFDKKVLSDDTPLREILFRDLDKHWQNYEGAERTKQLHGTWSKTTINLNMRHKHGTSLLHGASCGTGVLKCDLSKSGVVGSEKCRKGCQAIETLEHIILECHHYDTCRVKLRSECLKLNLDFTVNNAMCHPSLHLLTEKIFVLLNK